MLATATDEAITDLPEDDGKPASAAGAKQRRTGIKISEEITPLYAINEVMESLQCVGVSFVELVMAVDEVLHDSPEPTAFDVITTVCERRGLLLQALTPEELQERKSSFRFDDFDVGYQALFVFDLTRPLFVVAVPVENRRARHQGQLKLVVPISDPVPYTRLVSKVSRLSKSESRVIICTRPDDVPPRAPLGKEIEAPKNFAAIAQRIAPNNNPFSSLPVVHVTKRRSKKSHRLWYQRLLEKKAIDTFRRAGFQSQLDTADGADEDF